MPYQLSFTKKFSVSDEEIYINPCCWGGDVIRDRVLPLVDTRYTEIMTEQEDWGWFIWFKRGEVSLAIDIHTDDPEIGAFRVHLYSRKRKLLFFSQEIDTPELEELKDLVAAELQRWAGAIEVAPMQ
jgi:hypothetical protein